MLSVWLNLSGAPSRACDALATTLLDAAEQAAVHAARDAPLVLLGGPSHPRHPHRVHVPAPHGLSPHDWPAALDAAIASRRIPAGADVLLLSPMAGPVTQDTVSDFLGRADRNALCVAALPLHSNRHPSWLLTLDSTARLLPSGDVLCTSPPEPLDLNESLSPEAAAYLKAGSRIRGSQWLPGLAEGSGAMVLCPAGLLADSAYRQTPPRPVRLDPNPEATLLLHTLFAKEAGVWT